MTRLVIGTRNPGKVSEIKTILGDVPHELVSLADFREFGTPAEDGLTYAENAISKARRYAEQIGLPTLADDSGLEVEALNWGPGVFSARYAGDEASDADRRALLLAEMSKRKNAIRNARFVCAVAIAHPDQTVINVAEATCVGTIAKVGRGDSGFGYDPLFIPDGFDFTFAELDGSLKNQISHRGKALAETREFLLRHEF